MLLNVYWEKLDDMCSGGDFNPNFYQYTFNDTNIYFNYNTNDIIICDKFYCVTKCNTCDDKYKIKKIG